MLMQSHSSELSLLPALPSQWPAGEITGLRARGGYEVSLAWQNGQLSAADITAQLDNTCRLRTRIPVKALSGGKEIPAKQLEDGLIEFKVKAGERFRIIPK
jgi:alpha-L-fucosidase 2